MHRDNFTYSSKSGYHFSDSSEDEDGQNDSQHGEYAA
jgi:hypothetical protein